MSFLGPRSIILNITNIVLPSTSMSIGSISCLTYYVSKGPLTINIYYLSL